MHPVPESFRCTVGLAQISANPAYADASKAFLLEPLFPDDANAPGLFKLAGIEEIQAIRLEIRDEYLSHISRKLDAIVRFAAGKNVEVLVFPEYSVPAEVLPLYAKSWLTN